MISRPHMNMFERPEHEHISFAFWSNFLGSNGGGMFGVVGMRGCVDWFIEHEGASATEWAISRSRFKEEDSTELLHVKINWGKLCVFSPW